MFKADRQVPGIPAQFSKHSGVAGVAGSAAQRVVPKLRPRGTGAVSCRGTGEEGEQKTHGFGQGRHGNRTVWDSNGRDTSPCLPPQLPKAHQHRGEQWGQPGPRPNYCSWLQKRTKGNGTLCSGNHFSSLQKFYVTSTSQKLNWRRKYVMNKSMYNLHLILLKQMHTSRASISSNALRLQGIKKDDNGWNRGQS